MMKLEAHRRYKSGSLPLQVGDRWIKVEPNEEYVLSEGTDWDMGGVEVPCKVIHVPGSSIRPGPKAEVVPSWKYRFKFLHAREGMRKVGVGAEVIEAYVLFPGIYVGCKYANVNLFIESRVRLIDCAFQGRVILRDDLDDRQIFEDCSHKHPIAPGYLLAFQGRVILRDDLDDRQFEDCSHKHPIAPGYLLEESEAARGATAASEADQVTKIDWDRSLGEADRQALRSMVSRTDGATAPVPASPERIAQLEAQLARRREAELPTQPMSELLAAQAAARDECLREPCASRRNDLVRAALQVERALAASTCREDVLLVAMESCLLHQRWAALGHAALKAGSTPTQLAKQDAERGRFELECLKLGVIPGWEP